MVAGLRYDQSRAGDGVVPTQKDHALSKNLGAVYLGALGGTISGAGPSVLLWCFWQDTGKVVEAATAEVDGWAEVRRLPFSPLGADVPEL